jgi:hypothetical protein
MAEYVILELNWSDELSAALRKAAPGDVIIVNSETKRKLAESAALRMGKNGIAIRVATE